MDHPVSSETDFLDFESGARDDLNAVMITVPALLRVWRDKDGRDAAPPVRRPRLNLPVRRARGLRL